MTLAPGYNLMEMRADVLGNRDPPAAELTHFLPPSENDTGQNPG
jgi:hypothetical protein